MNSTLKTQHINHSKWVTPDDIHYCQLPIYLQQPIHSGIQDFFFLSVPFFLLSSTIYKKTTKKPTPNSLVWLLFPLCSRELLQKYFVVCLDAVQLLGNTVFLQLFIAATIFPSFLLLKLLSTTWFRYSGSKSSFWVFSLFWSLVREEGERSHYVPLGLMKK